MRGFLDTHIVGQYFRDFRLMRIFEGPTELMLVYMGSLLAKNDASFIGLLKSEQADPALIKRLQNAIERMRNSTSVDTATAGRES